MKTVCQSDCCEKKVAENGFQSQEKFWLLFEVSKVFIGC